MGRVARYKRAKVLKHVPESADRMHALPPSAANAADGGVPRAVRGLAFVQRGKAAGGSLGVRQKQQGIAAAGKKKARQKQTDASNGGGKGKSKSEIESGSAEGSADLGGSGKSGSNGRQTETKKRAVPGTTITNAPEESRSKPETGADVAWIRGLTRKPTESLHAFNRRVDRLTADSLYAAARKSTNVVAKRKAWNQNKQARKRDRREEREQLRLAVEDNPLAQVEDIGFGEVADAPPQIKAAPRVRGGLKRAPLLLSAKLAAAAASHVSPIQQAEREQERERAIAAYRSAKRRARDD